MAQDKSPAGEVDGRREVADPTVEEATGTVMSGTGTGWSTTRLAAAEGLLVLGVAVVVAVAAAAGSGRDPTWQEVVVAAEVASCTAGAVCTNPFSALP